MDVLRDAIASLVPDVAAWTQPKLITVPTAAVSLVLEDLLVFFR